MTNQDRQLGMASPITRRDFLNGVAIGIGGVLAAGGGGIRWRDTARAGHVEPVSTGAHRPARVACRVVRSAALDEGRRVLEDRAGSAGHARAVRPGGRRRRHQRPLGSSFLSQGQAGRAHPGARQPRRFRRPRQAQRVHTQRTHLHRLRRHAVDRQPGALQCRGQGAHRRIGHRRRALFEGARLGTLQVARPALGIVLRQGNLRRRSAGRRRRRATRRSSRRRRSATLSSATSSGCSPSASIRCPA